MPYNMIFSEFPELETERLLLRKLTEEDSEALYKIMSKEEVMVYYGMYALVEEEQAQIMINNLNCGFESSKSIRWALELKEESTLIGTCGYHNWNKGYARSEMGYELSPDYWGKGYMTEALEAILCYGFNYMELNRVEALVYPENSASKRLLEGLGFMEEGILREYAYFRDVYQDLVMFSLIREK